jgi:hypothetical protein
VRGQVSITPDIYSSNSNQNSLPGSSMNTQGIDLNIMAARAIQQSVQLHQARARSKDLLRSIIYQIFR